MFASNPIHNQATGMTLNVSAYSGRKYNEEMTHLLLATSRQKKNAFLTGKHLLLLSLASE